MKGCASDNILAMAGVDHVFAAPVFNAYPGAPAGPGTREPAQYGPDNLVRGEPAPAAPAGAAC